MYSCDTGPRCLRSHHLVAAYNNQDVLGIYSYLDPRRVGHINGPQYTEHQGYVEVIGLYLLFLRHFTLDTSNPWFHGI
jgi:hypothetical protein